MSNFIWNKTRLKVEKKIMNKILETRWKSEVLCATALDLFKNSQQWEKIMANCVEIAPKSWIKAWLRDSVTAGFPRGTWPKFDTNGIQLSHHKNISSPNSFLCHQRQTLQRASFPGLIKSVRLMVVFRVTKRKLFFLSEKPVNLQKYDIKYSRKGLTA